MPKWLRIYFSGVLMGAADVVPGVSGGTIAFILGIYDRLIGALSGVNAQSIALLRKGEINALWRHFDGTFLLTLGAGVVTSIFLLAGVISHLLVEYPSYLWSFFFGLILASAYFLISQIAYFSSRHFGVILIGIAFGASLSLLVPTQFDTSLTMVFFSGLIAICAMILPGISGSFLLLIMGMYGFILSAIKNLDFVVIFTFAVGAVIGLLSFSKILNLLLLRARSMTLSLLTGIMLGALVKVWPWKVADAWSVVGDKKIPTNETLILPWQLDGYVWLSDLLVPCVFMLAGLLSVVIISRVFYETKP